MSGEKSFAPSEKRLREAANKGDILRSREVATAVAMLAGAAGLHFAGPWLFAALGDGLRGGLSWRRDDLENFKPGALGWDILCGVLPPLLALALGSALAVLAAQLALADGRWVGGNLMPRGTRLSPMAGLKRMFGAAGWIEVAKGVAKVALLGAIGWYWAASTLPPLLLLGKGAALGGQLAQAWQAITGLFFALAAGLAVIAPIDFPIQWLRRMRRLRMSHQELRDEAKEAEGSPERKAAMRQRQRQYAGGAVAKAMREAQFVLTNPSHFAVAMTYDPSRAAAPLVLAKGRGDKALAMRELAAELALPCLEYPALARSVYFTTRENQTIREELYAAVAGVLAFVLSLRRGEASVPPPIEVPVALRFDADGRRDPGATG